MTLTADSVKKLKPRTEAFYLSDDKVRGLQLRIAPDGSRSWSVRYRYGKRQRRLTLGDAAVIPLNDDTRKTPKVKGARTLAREALHLVTTGVDPADAKREKREAVTVADLADEYMRLHAKPKKRSWKNDQRILDTEILPEWKHRAAREITRRDVRELTEAIAARGPILANRVRALISKLFNFALQRDLVESNPVIGTPRPGVERQRDRVLTADEIRRLWYATETMAPVMAAVFKMRLLTAQRGGEVINMRWQDLDLPNAMWTIPSEYSKNKLPHRVPLSAPAVEILTDLRTTVDAALAKSTTAVAPVFVMRGARGNRQRGTAAKTLKIGNFRGHDLRRTAASYMASSGTPRLVISKVLNHVEQGITSVYDRHSYDNEKRIALDQWSRTLTAILTDTPSKVVAFGKGR